MTNLPQPQRRAIVLAAGLSSRLYPKTLVRPKPLLQLSSNETIIDRQLDCLTKLGIDDVTVVTGHGASELERHLGNRVQLRHYPDFASYGNLHTLNYINDLLDRPLLIAFGDIVAEYRLWFDITTAQGEFNLLVDEGLSIPGTMRVQHISDHIHDLGPHIPVNKGTGTFVGLASFGKHAAHALAERISVIAKKPEFTQAVYTDALASLVRTGEKLHVVPTRGRQWIEVDDHDDYEEALRLESITGA